VNTTIDDGGRPSEKRVQTRSVVTRRRILDSAIRLFAEQGYPATGTREIIAQSGMTGGAFYHHFGDKDSVAKAILAEANARVLAAFVATDAGGPAVEAAIRGTFAVASLHVRDAGVRVGSQLLHTVGRTTGQAGRYFAAWSDALGAQFDRGQRQGDVRNDLDPEVVGRSVASASYGAWAVAGLTPGDSNVVTRMGDLWGVMLPAIVVPEVAPRFLGYLREQCKQLAGERPY
jgi:AcrR family transcriptional regulator